eukprot:3354411-Rhodomonas_salina.5
MLNHRTLPLTPLPRVDLSGQRVVCVADMPLCVTANAACFAELIIPEYKSEESLLESFELALSESFNAFGLA